MNSAEVSKLRILKGFDWHIGHKFLGIRAVPAHPGIGVLGSGFGALHTECSPCSPQLAAPVHPVRIPGPAAQTLCQGAHGHKGHPHGHE